jgi:hypothetical protein
MKRALPILFIALLATACTKQSGDDAMKENNFNPVYEETYEAGLKIYKDNLYPDSLVTPEEVNLPKYLYNLDVNRKNKTQFFHSEEGMHFLFYKLKKEKANLRIRYIIQICKEYCREPAKPLVQ